MTTFLETLKACVPFSLLSSPFQTLLLEPLLLEPPSPSHLRGVNEGTWWLAVVKHPLDTPQVRSLLRSCHFAWSGVPAAAVEGGQGMWVPAEAGGPKKFPGRKIDFGGTVSCVWW